MSIGDDDSSHLTSALLQAHHQLHHNASEAGCYYSLPASLLRQKVVHVLSFVAYACAKHLLEEQLSLRHSSAPGVAVRLLEG